MPNLDPPTTTAQYLDEVFALYAEQLDRRLQPQPGGHPARTRSRAMAERGIRAYKVYMVVDTGRTYPHPAGTGMHDHGDLLRMMDQIAGTGLRFIIHPHDQALMDYIEREYWDRGDNTPQGYASAYAARDGVIWDTAVDVVLRLAEASGCPVHLAHMQTAAVDRGGPAGQGPRRRRHLRGEPLGAVPVHLGGRGAAWAVRAVVLGARRGPGGHLGRHARRDHRHRRPPTTPRTPARRRRSAGPQMWSAHTGTPGIQYYYPLLLDAVDQGRAHPGAGGRRWSPTHPAEQFGLAGARARSRSGATPTS